MAELHVKTRLVGPGGKVITTSECNVQFVGVYIPAGTDLNLDLSIDVDSQGALAAKVYEAKEALLHKQKENDAGDDYPEMVVCDGVDEIKVACCPVTQRITMDVNPDHEDYSSEAGYIMMDEDQAENLIHALIDQLCRVRDRKRSTET